MASTVRGSAKRGRRQTHSNRATGKGRNLTNHRVNGGSGNRAAANVSGSAGNAMKSGTP
jgi:hypothetical protein